MKTIIIAEAGVNHNGDLKKALKMVNIAARANADFIKFQTFIPENLAQSKLGLAQYQKKQVKYSSQLEMLKKLSLSFSDFKKIKKRCITRKIRFMTSPFDEESVEFLNKLKVQYIKIPSGEITNIPYLRKIGKLKKKIILSTGMSNLKEIRNAINLLTKSGTNKDKISILHCSTEYPATIENLNLRSINYLSKKLKMKIGYSDHSIGYEASLMAVSLGAKILEKHFTINKNAKGPDHSSSLSPTELRNYVNKVRIFEKSLGKDTKKPNKKELKNLNIIRKQIVAKKNIKKGEKFTIFNITTKRAIKGVPASNWDKVIGKKSKYTFKSGTNIKII